MKGLATGVGGFALMIALTLASSDPAHARRMMPPPAAAHVAQVSPERFALEASVLVDVAVEGLSGRLAVTHTADGYRLDLIAPHSSAALLGLQVGDVVRSINGVALTNRAALRQAHAAARNSRVLTVDATRGGAPVSLRYRIVSDASRVALFTRPLSPDATNVLALMSAGIKRVDATHVTIDRAVLEALTDAGRWFGDTMTDPVDGLVVYRAGSLLETLGLEVFDQIEQIDGARVPSERSLLRSLADAADARTIALTVQRNGAPVEISYAVVEQSFDATGLQAAVTPPPAKDPYDVDAKAWESALDSGISEKSPTHYVVKRGLIDMALANPMAVARGARIVPSIKNGKANGFKLYAIRPSSIYARVGFANGDTIHSINGMDLTTADKALEVYTALRDTKSMKFELTRRGKPVTLRIDIK